MLAAYINPGRVQTSHTISCERENLVREKRPFGQGREREKKGSRAGGVVLQSEERVEEGNHKEEKCKPLWVSSLKLYYKLVILLVL